MAEAIGFENTIKWYDENARQYAEAGASYADLHHIQTFATLLPPGGRVLDAGCGAGRDTALLHDQGLEVTGLDISGGLLAEAHKRFPGLSLVKGDLRRLPFGNASFDGVWSNTSLLHLETVKEVSQALLEMNRVLTSRGVLHIVVKAQTGEEKTAIVADKLSGHDRFFQYFTQEEMRGLLRDSGFSLLNLKEYSETDTIPHGRPEVRIIWGLASKE